MVLKTKKVLALIVSICMLAAFVPAAAVYAEETEAPVVNITVDGKPFEDIGAGGEIIIGDKDINEADIRIVSVNGHQLENVGTKSGVLDSQGRTVLEFNAVKAGDGVWRVRLCYHAIDDPVEANRAYGFDIVQILFKKSADAAEQKPAVPKIAKIKNLKVRAQTKALKLSWNKVDCTGYKVQYSTKSNFSKAKTITIRKNTCTVKNLKKGTKYYIRVCAYKTYDDGLGNLKTVKSSWVKSNGKSK